MKKLLTLLITFLYIGTSSGATIHLHYCMGKIIGWELTGKFTGTCGNCGMEKSVESGDDCCKDEIKVIKNEADQKSNTSTLQLFSFQSEVLPVAVEDFTAVFLSPITKEIPLAHAPPRNSKLAVYLLCQSFLI